MQKINPCLWFDKQAEESAQLYTSLFADSKILRTTHYGESGAQVSGQKLGSVLTVDFELEGLKIIGLNGGPLYKFNPTFSFFVWCETEEEIDRLWQNLSNYGKVRTSLDKYPWAQKYGWVSDRYGVEWQVALQVALSDRKKKVAPSFLFTDQLLGKGQEAINFYMSIFKNSKIEFMAQDETTKAIMHCVFSLEGQSFVLMEGQGKYDYSFSEAFSLVVNCETQGEVDEYWSKLSEGGTAGQCGWLKDKYGVSWQVVPTLLKEITSEKNPRKSENVMKNMLQMKKLDIKRLQESYEEVQG